MFAYFLGIFENQPNMRCLFFNFLCGEVYFIYFIVRFIYSFIYLFIGLFIYCFTFFFLRSIYSPLLLPFLLSYWRSVKYALRYLRLIGLVVRVFTDGPGDLGSIPGHVIPKTFKMVLDTSLLNTQINKVRIKGKVEQSRERCSALLYA